MADKVVTRTCPECGHKHSLAASTEEAATFISEVERQRDELQAELQELRAVVAALDALPLEELHGVVVLHACDLRPLWEAAWALRKARAR